jgi:hypothetical protein
MQNVMISTISASYWGILASNPRSEKGYTDIGLSQTSLILSGKCWNSSSNYAMSASFHVISISLLTDNPTILPLEEQLSAP